MKRVLYLDCVGGAGGDMILSALISVGAPFELIEQGLSSIPVGEYSIKTWKEKRFGVEGLRLDVEFPAKQPHRGFSDLERLITASSVPDPVKETAIRVFSALADAEAAVHGVPKEKIHFHEVGAVDAVVDVVGSCLALSLLQVDEVVVSPLPLGGGIIKAAHGPLPLPAPATVELLKGIPSYGVDIQGETVTPTAAAILGTVATRFGGFPFMKAEKVGYGVGSREWETRPNVLRSVIGVTEEGESDYVMMLETNLDDMNPELYGPLMEKLFEMGALDVSLIPAYMKKNRPGVIIHALVRPFHLDQALDIIFRETTTIGVRYYKVERRTLPREIVSIETRYGSVEMKKVVTPDGRVSHYPEFESVKKVAREKGIPVKEVYRAAEAAVFEAEKP